MVHPSTPAPTAPATRSPARWRALALLPLLLGLLAGCGGGTTPPGPSTAWGGMDDGSTYTFDVWDDGLRILVVYAPSVRWDACHGDGSTDDPTYRLTCQATTRADGRNVPLAVQTRVGTAPAIQIDGAAYDLAQGTVFVIGTHGPTVTITQLQRDLRALARDDPILRAYVAQDQPMQAALAAR